MMHQPDFSDDSEGFSDDPDYEDFKKRTARKYELTPEEIKNQERKNTIDSLFIAINTGDEETVFKIIDSGINIEEQISGTWTPILLACSYGKPNIVKGLIERGANIHSSHDGSTALMLVCGCTSYISDNKSILEVIKLLVNNGADVNAINKKRMTCLMHAASVGNLEAVKYLLPISNKDAEDNQGWTALFWAVHSNNVEVVQYLLEQGFNSSCKDIRNLTPLDYAQANDYQNVVDLFEVEETDSALNILHCCKTNTQEILETERPRLFKDICTILSSLNSEPVIKYLVNTDVTLRDFLSVNENILKSWSIKMPFQRNRILNGLYKYHKHPYHPKSLLVVSPKEIYSNKDIAIQLLCTIKQITSMGASLQFILNNKEEFGNDNMAALKRSLQNIRRDLQFIKTNTRKLERKVHQWDALLTPPDLIVKKAGTWKRQCVLLVGISAISLYVYLKRK